MITIRPYRGEDERALIALARELQAFESGLNELMKPADAIGAWYVEMLERKCAETSGAILIAEYRGEIAGYAAVLGKHVEEGDEDEVEHSYTYVEDLAVAAPFRRKGIATALLKACEDVARQAGQTDLRLNVLAKNPDAHALYEKAGFGAHMISLRKRLA